MQQAQKLVLLVRLCGVVGGPLLGIGGLFDRFGDRDRLGDGGAAVAMFLRLIANSTAKICLHFNPRVSWSGQVQWGASGSGLTV